MIATLLLLMLYALKSFMIFSTQIKSMEHFHWNLSILYNMGIDFKMLQFNYLY